MSPTDAGSGTGSRTWLSEDDCDLDAFRSLIEQGTDPQAYPSAERVVNIISTCAHGGQPYLAPYSAAKTGLAGLTRNAAHAHRWDRIRINGLSIGWTDTEGEDATQRAFHDAGDDWREKAAQSQPMGKPGQVDEIADFAVFLLSDRSGVVTGSVIDWDQIVFGGLDEPS